MKPQHPILPPNINRFGQYTFAAKGFVFMTSMTARQALDYIKRFTSQYGEVTVWTDFASGRLRFWSIGDKIRIWYSSANGIIIDDAETFVGHLPLHDHEIRDEPAPKRSRLEF